MDEQSSTSEPVHGDFGPMEAVMLLGEDHLAADRYAMCSVGDAWRTVCSISLGGVEAVGRKGGTQVPNEDCLFAADFGPRALHAVADGHKGHRASHGVIRRVADLVTGPDAIAEALRTLDWTAGDPEDDDLPDDPSRTTLAVLGIDRDQGHVRGWSMGDSAVFHLNLTTGITQLNEPGHTYMTPFSPEPVPHAQVHRFQRDVSPGDIILTCTDGVFECHYGSPATSLGPDELESLYIRYSGDVDAFVEAVSHDALMGVRGHPGGQDNIAIIASVV